MIINLTGKLDRVVEIDEFHSYRVVVLLLLLLLMVNRALDPTTRKNV